jgi:hypothetical protein
MSKFRPFNNTPLLSKSFASDSRPQRRRRAIQHAMDNLRRRFAGSGSSGTNTWPENMPKRVRKLISRDAAKNNTQPRPELPQVQPGLTDYQKEQQVIRHGKN